MQIDCNFDVVEPYQEVFHSLGFWLRESVRPTIILSTRSARRTFVVVSELKAIIAVKIDSLKLCITDFHFSINVTIFPYVLKSISSLKLFTDVGNTVVVYCWNEK